MEVSICDSAEDIQSLEDTISFFSSTLQNILGYCDMVSKDINIADNDLIEYCNEFIDECDMEKLNSIFECMETMEECVIAFNKHKIAFNEITKKYINK